MYVSGVGGGRRQVVEEGREGGRDRGRKGHKDEAGRRRRIELPGKCHC